MDEFKASQIIKIYEGLENDFIDFVRVVPYDDKQNTNVWSPKLAEILIGCGSILDSLFRTSMPESFNGKDRKNFDFNDFCLFFSTELKPLKSFAYLSPPKLVLPYEDWTTAKAPNWWTNYNKVKHDRIENMTLATSFTVLYALAGLFEAITNNQKMAKALIRHRWADIYDYNPDIVVPKLDTKKLSEAIGDGRTLLIETNLFATTNGSAVFPDNIEDIKPASYIGTDKKLISYLGKWFHHYY